MDIHSNPPIIFAPQWLFLDLPVTDYREALALQEAILAAKKSGVLQEDVLVLLEHEPVFTLGNRGGREFIRVPESFLVKKKVPVVKTERGGFITYHGPGQIVAYPIIDLKRARIAIKAYVEALEEIMIRTAADFGVRAARHEKNRGVWIGSRKLGSVGIRVKRNISMHGLAFNVDPDLRPFSWVAPCGLEGVRVTSLAEEGAAVSVAVVRERMAAHLASFFTTRFLPVTVADFATLLDPHLDEVWAEW